MEKITKKLFLGTSAIALTALALAPIAAINDNSAYAVKCVYSSDPQQQCPDIASPSFSVTVNTPTLTLALDPDDGPDDLNFSTADLKSGTFSVIVTSNRDYYIALSAKQPNLVSGANSIAAANNPSALPNGWDTSDSQTGWGIKKYHSKSNEDHTQTEDVGYTAITGEPKVFYTEQNIGEADATTKQTIQFTYGIGVAAGQPSGEYSTTVTVTATTAGSTAN